MKNWKYIEGAKIGNDIPDAQINGPSAAEIREVAGRIYKTDMREDDLARAVSFELAKKYKAFQTNTHLMDMVKEVLKKFKTGNKKVGNASHTKEDAKTKDEYFKLLKFYQLQGYKTKAGEYNSNGKIKMYKGEDSVEINLVGNSKTGNESLGEYMSKKPRVINEEKTGAEEFFKKLAKDGEERAEKDDKDIEKVGNALGKDIYQHKLDPNQYMVVDWDKDTVTIIVNGVVRDVIKNTDKVAYAVDHVYKRVNSMNKVGNQSPQERLNQDLSIIKEKCREKGISLSFSELAKELEKYGWDFNELRKLKLPVSIGNSASDDKFAYVMREFDEGKLKTPDGKVVTDPAQAKAIAYSESKKAENGLARARNAIKK